MKQNCLSTTSTNARIIVVLAMLLAFIFSTAAAYAETEETFAPIEKTFKPRSTRDPFMPCVGKKTAPVDENKPVQQPGDKGKKVETINVGTGKGSDVKTPVGVGQKKIRLVDVSDQIQVTGIMKSGGINQAIINHNGNGYLVKPGQRLGDWTVTSIGRNTVVLMAKRTKAVLKLESDIAKPKGGGVPSPGK